jgi:DNA-binding LacI/PurR family transcriptional regulator
VSTSTDKKRVTAADIARALGISRATVGFVLNSTPGQTISAATRARVLEEARLQGYQPHRAAQALASGRSRLILLVLPEWPIDYSMRTHIDEMSLALDESGYSLVTTTPHPDARARPLWETLNPDVVLGLVPLSPDQERAVLSSGSGAVVPKYSNMAPQDETNFADGPRLQVEHLVQRGRRHLAFAGSNDPRIAELVEERRRRAEHAASDVGLDILSETDVDSSTVADVVSAWLDAGIDGIVAYNDDIAALVAGAAIRRGKHVPADVAVIGHDDSPLAQLFVPALSSIHINYAGLGRYLAQLALSAVDGSPSPESGPLAQVTVVAREST